MASVRTIEDLYRFPGDGKVELVGGEIIRVFRATDPESPAVYGRGEIADAEPALPGFRMPVDDIFE